MPQVKPEVEAFARIKVFGVGGSGKNAVNHMINSKVKGVEFVAINTDAQDLHHTLAKKKIHIGKNLTRGLGTGMNPELGRKAIEENKEEIQEAIKGADMLFIAGGMGGGTCTGSAPVIARTAKDLGVLTVAVITKPFFFEGPQRMKYAEQGVDELKSSVDAIIIIPNDRLLSAIEKDTTAKNAFAMCDDILKQAVEGISDLITTPGIINTDFADIRAIMQNAGTALMGIGVANGEKRAEEAAKSAINSPLLELSIDGAQGVLFSIAGGDDLTMHEIQDAASIITESVDKNAKIIFGTVKDDKLKKGEVKITVIASGFSEEVLKNGVNHKIAASKSNGVANNETTSSATTATPSMDSNKEDKKAIHNNLPSQETKKKDVSSDNEKLEQAAETEVDDDDDWGAVPAFLRRSKLK